MTGSTRIRLRHKVKPGRVILLAAMITLAVIYMIPLIWMLLTSLKTNKELSLLPIRMLPAAPQWVNYKTVFSVVPFANAFKTSLLATLGTVVLVVITSSMGGYSFAKLEYPGRDAIFNCMLATMMVPFFLLAIPLFYIFRILGLINSIPGLILPMGVSAFGTFLMRQNIMAIPTDLVHAARIDGCSEGRIFWQIILPLAKGAIGTLIIFSFIQAWDEFMWALMIAQKPDIWTLPLVLRKLEMADQKMYHLQMAGATMAVIPTIIVFAFAQKQIIQSVALSGLKL
jgi:multiple sugar transport system permease protein